MLTIENVEVLRYTNLGNNFWISQVSKDYDRNGKAYYGFTITNNIFVATIFLERELDFELFVLIFKFVCCFA